MLVTFRFGVLACKIYDERNFSDKQYDVQGEYVQRSWLRKAVAQHKMERMPTSETTTM